MEESETPLFGPREDWDNNACLSYASDQWGIYADGFQQAVAVLCEHATETTMDLDILVYPIVFNCRHAFELRLKHVLLYATSLNNERLKKVPQTHKIGELWQEVRRLIDALFPNQPVWQLDSLEYIIGEFEKLDNFSTAFRYPFDRDGSPSLEIKHINIAQFCEKVIPALDDLEWMASYIHEGLVCRYESMR